METIFPGPISDLPEADIPLAGVTAFLSQSAEHQVIFMQFREDADLPEHAHAAQVGFVLRGRIELTVGGVRKEYTQGDIYCIPEGVSHSGKIFAGYADITFFADPRRYLARK
jgi:quercetin dioxygenase-like cupin family protein